MNGVFSTPRPVPGRRVPALAGAAVIVLGLPVFLVGGFSLGGWALAAVLWAAGEALGFWLARIPTGADHLGKSGMVAIAMSFRGIGVMVVLLAVTVANRSVGISAVALYALAYSLTLAVSLAEYFGSEKIR
ncbi:MAG TPA: hypothetical protein VFA42_07735 [Gaiellaceae bacterium]|nr:hypothetical protein [Gaiellaceae bacterium]HZQ89883.1 hypothetical protein [Gaiellaceae bacterium]